MAPHLTTLPDPASSSGRERDVAGRKPPHRVPSSPSSRMSRLWLQPRQPPQPALMPSPSSNIHGATGAGGRTVPFPACSTGGSRERNSYNRGERPSAAMGRMQGRSTGEAAAGSRTTGWEAAAPEILNSGLGLQRGGRCEGCFAAASLCRCVSEPTTGQRAAASTGHAAARHSKGGCPWGLEAPLGQRGRPEPSSVT